MVVLRKYALIHESKNPHTSTFFSTFLNTSIGL